MSSDTFNQTSCVLFFITLTLDHDLKRRKKVIHGLYSWLQNSKEKHVSYFLSFSFRVKDDPPVIMQFCLGWISLPSLSPVLLFQCSAILLGISTLFNASSPLPPLYKHTPLDWKGCILLVTRGCCRVLGFIL